jgi:hypothetical protein
MAELHNRNMNNNEVAAPLTFKVDPEQNGAYVMTKETQGTLKMADKVVIVETRNSQDTRDGNDPNWKEHTYNFTYKDGENDIHDDVQANTLRDAVESFLMRKGWTPANVDINEAARNPASNFTIH